MADATEKVRLLRDNTFSHPCNGPAPGYEHPTVIVDLQKDRTAKIRTGKCENCGQVYYSRITGMGY